MNNVKIKKAKIKDELFLEVEFTEELPGHSKKETKLSCTVPIHDDLKHSFQVLHKHLAILCDEVKVKGKSFENFHHEDLAQFKVYGFSISGSEENERVTISGCKDGKYGVVNLNSPTTKYDDNEYLFIDELAEHIQTCLYEVEEYLFNGKRAPDRQLEMAFDDPDENAETLETV
jgi:hypothetical protein